MDSELSTKLKADYAELASQYLDAIPISSEEEARIAIAALRGLTAPPDQASSPLSLKGRVKEIYEHADSLREVLDNPDMYAKPEHVKGFKKIIQGQIARKISEITSFLPKDIAENIERIESKRREAAAYKEKIAGLEPPKEGTPAHVVPYEEPLRKNWFSMNGDSGLQARSDERRVGLEKIRKDASAFLSLSPALRNNRGFILEAIVRNPSVLKYVSEALKNDREFNLEVVRRILLASRRTLLASRRTLLALRHISKAMKNDREFNLEAVRRTLLDAQVCQRGSENRRNFPKKITNAEDNPSKKRRIANGSRGKVIDR